MALLIAIASVWDVFVEEVAVGYSFYPERMINIALFLLGGWLLKYLLTGRKGFFPWMTK